MGESASARTRRELDELRGQIDRDLDALLERAREDADPRRLARRQPVAFFGALGSLAALAAAAIARKARARRPDEQLDRVIERLGGRLSKLKGKARKRFRESLRKEMAEVETPKRTPKEVAWTAGVTAITAAAAELARRFAGLAMRDERRRGEPSGTRSGGEPLP
ncbi:MAG TPA: hypothetical protein VMJ92_01480 [Candidatus Limnocylindrales bacterium]|nr:hypothetical protein [Candidatus Limnocylindrales bacterium]